MLNLFVRDGGVGDDGTRNRGYEVVVGGSILTALATAGMLARFISARMLRRSVDVSDGLLILAFSLNVFQFGVLAWATKHAGWGRHVATVSPKELEYFSKVFLVCSCVQPTLLLCSKMSVLLLLHRIFAVRKFRIVVYVFMAVVVAWWVAITLATYLICTPFDSNWGAHPANCGNSHVLDYVAPIPWIVTDFGILIMPMPMIKRLHLPLRQKVALTGLFLLGGLTCVISCVRYRYVFFSFTDITWETMGLAIWQLAEANITILCACLLASRPFAMLLIPDRFAEWVGSCGTTVKTYLSRRRKTSSTASSLTQVETPPKTIHKSFEVQQYSVPRTDTRDAIIPDRELQSRV